MGLQHPLQRWGQKKVKVLLSLFFCPITEVLPLPLEHQWFLQLVAELRSEAGGWDQQIPLEKLWHSQDSVQQTDRITTYSHASSGLQQQSTCITHNTCKTASLCSHRKARLNRIISCSRRMRHTQTTTSTQLRQLAAPAPQSPSNDKHSMAEAHRKHQAAGMLPLCLSTNTALLLARIHLAMVQTQQTTRK